MKHSFSCSEEGDSTLASLLWT